MRRVLLGENRKPKAVLGRGEHKSLQTDRVVLQPGPAEEVETVGRMFRLVVDEHRSPSEIADILNSEGIMTDLGLRWTATSVRGVLTNEKYVGNNVFHRTSSKLGQPRVANSPDKWIRAERVFPAIVNPELFHLARTVLASRGRARRSDSEMLDQLRDLFAARGSLSAVIIDEAVGMPSSGTYAQRFGGLRRAYKLIGYASGRNYRFVETNRALRSLHSDLVDDIILNLQRRGSQVSHDPKTELLTINGEFTSSIVIARCSSTHAGNTRWKLRLETALRPDITVALRMAPKNESPLDYYLLPRIDFAQPRLTLAQHNPRKLDAYRFDSLEALFRIGARTPLRIVQ